MKYRRCFFFALAALAVLTALPVCAHAHTAFSSSDVQCVVEPVYAFTLPPDAKIQYPQTQVMVGHFRVGELLLSGGESLGVTLTPGELKNEDGETLPYTVLFEPPEMFDEAQSKEEYSITVRLDEDAFTAAVWGTYTASLLFRVVSYPAGKVVWQDEVILSAVKPQNPESIAGEDVPATGILSNGVFWLVAAAAAALSVSAIILFLRKAKREIKMKQSETYKPETNDTHSAKDEA